MTGLEPVCRRVVALLERSVSGERALHSRSVALLAEDLAARFGVDPVLAHVAGLGHDIARELDNDSIRALAVRDGRGEDEDEARMPVLLHGRAAAVLLEAEAGVTHGDVLDAVRDHVTGRPGMGTLARILFAADYLEPRRGFLEERRRRLILAGGLDDMVLVAVRDTIRHLGERNRPVARKALDLAEELGERRERLA